MKIDFSRILNEAYRITWKNKWLWILGLVLAASSFSGNNIPNESFSDTDSSKDSNTQIEDTNENNNTKPLLTPPSNQESLNIPKLNTTNVLGYATSNTTLEGDLTGNNTVSADPDLDRILETIYNFFGSLGVTYILIVGIVFLIFIIISVILSLLLRSWAQASLIYGINHEANNINVESINLSDMSKGGKTKIKELLKLWVIPGLVLFVILGIPIVVISIIWALNSDNSDISALSFLGVSALALLYIAVAIVMYIISIFAEIVLVIEKTNWKASLKRGFSIFKGYFLDTFLMGIINCGVGCFVSLISCVTMIPFFILLGLVVLGIAALPITSILLLPLGIVVLILFVIVISLIASAKYVFTQATWVLFYKQVIELENKGGQQ